MTTRAKGSFLLSADKLIQSTTTSSPLSLVPTSVCAALIDPSWRHVMEEEYDILITNNTWDLVTHPVGSNIITDKWIFKYKFNSHGTLKRYKARWVLHDFTQRPDVGYDETFSSVVKLVTIHTVLTLAVSRS
jgi:hypothetical protein